MLYRASALASLVVLCLGFSASDREEEARTDVLHVLELEALTAEQIDALYAVPGVTAWVELGNIAVVAAERDLEFGVALTRRVVRGRTEDVLLARLDAAHAHEVLPSDAQVLAGAGRYAVVLQGVLPWHLDDVATAHPTEVMAMPWNTIVVARADRVEAAPTVHARAASAALVGDAVNALNTSVHAGLVGDLVGFGTRYTTVASFPNVTNWVVGKFAEMGLAPVKEAFQISGKTRHNVIAELPGKVTPEDVWVVCGHYDSTSQTPTTFAPGADDNASGAAGVLEMARALSGFEFDSTIRFIAFAGEEQGLVGSAAHVNKLKSAGTLGNVKGVINMDMIAYRNTQASDVLIEGRAGVSTPMMDLLSSLVPQYTSLVAFRSTNPFGSDHMPYINNGVNAVLTIEYEDWFNPNYHSTSDTLNTLSFPLALDILRLNVAAIATSAGISGTNGGGSTAGTSQLYGLGLGGSNIGAIDTSSTPNIGTKLTLQISGFDNSTGVQVAMCRRIANKPRAGGTLLVDLSRRFASLEAGIVNGSSTVSFDIPLQLNLIGVSAYIQAAGQDATLPAGLAFSNGLQITLGN